MKHIQIMAALALGASCGGGGDKNGDAVHDGESETDTHMKRAKELAQRIIIADTHIDVPYRLTEHWEDISRRTASGDFDFERARAGGLDVAFMSIYIPAEYQDAGGAKDLADSLITMVEGFEKQHPGKFKVVTSVEEVQASFGANKALLALGMENGAGIGDSLVNLQHFYDRGIRYITLTHSKCNKICDSSYDTVRLWNGLSPYGEQVVAEMNRLGIMVDVSHVSDSAFYDVLRITKVPPIATHSSCRHFTPGFERNMSDDMIRALAKAGGVIHINFGSSFINAAFNAAAAGIRDLVQAYADEHGIGYHSKEAGAYKVQLYREHGLRLATLKEVADHIDHVVQIAGIDHVGLGSDFDGVGPTLPTGLEDVSKYPALIRELLLRGYSEEDVAKICWGNLMKVWKAAEEAAGERN